MRTFELFGHGIGYTASPLIHHAALTHLGVADRYDYVVTDVSPADFPRALQRFRRDGEGAHLPVPAVGGRHRRHQRVMHRHVAGPTLAPIWPALRAATYPPGPAPIIAILK